MPLGITGGDHAIIMAVELMAEAEQLTGAISGITSLIIMANTMLNQFKLCLRSSLV